MSGNTVPYQSRDAQWPDYRSQPRELFQTTRLPEPRLQMSLPFDPLVPRTLRLPEVCDRRRALLGTPHIRTLTEFAERLQQDRPETAVPYFDPLDGGTAARILFLFEKPGPKNDVLSPRGSAFISRDNDGRTAEWTFRLMRIAGIPRSLIVIWNVVPWWDRRRVVSLDELREGVEHVRELLPLLPLLDTVVYVGERAASLLGGLPLRTFESYHPSPKVKSAWAAKWLAIPDEWARVMEGR